MADSAEYTQFWSAYQDTVYAFGSNTPRNVLDKIESVSSRDQLDAQWYGRRRAFYDAVGHSLFREDVERQLARFATDLDVVMEVGVSGYHAHFLCAMANTMLGTKPQHPTDVPKARPNAYVHRIWNGKSAQFVNSAQTYPFTSPNQIRNRILGGDRRWMMLFTPRAMHDVTPLREGFMLNAFGCDVDINRPEIVVVQWMTRFNRESLVNPDTDYFPARLKMALNAHYEPVIECVPDVAFKHFEVETSVYSLKSYAHTFEKELDSIPL